MDLINCPEMHRAFLTSSHKKSQYFCPRCVRERERESHPLQKVLCLTENHQPKAGTYRMCLSIAAFLVQFCALPFLLLFFCTTKQCLCAKKLKEGKGNTETDEKGEGATRRSPGKILTSPSIHLYQHLLFPSPVTVTVRPLATFLSFSQRDTLPPATSAHLDLT